MDRKSEKIQKLRDLVERNDKVRVNLGQDVLTFRAKLDFVSRVKKSLTTAPAKWAIGAVGVVAVLALFFRRKPMASTATTVKERSIPLVILGIVMAVARPLANVWATDKFKNYITARVAARQMVPNAPKPNAIPANPSI